MRFFLNNLTFWTLKRPLDSHSWLTMWPTQGIHMWLWCLFATFQMVLSWKIYSVSPWVFSPANPPRIPSIPVVFPAFFLDFPMVFHHLMSVSSCFDTAFPGKHSVPISSHGSCFDLQGAKGALPAAFCRGLRWQQRSTLEFEEHLVLRGKKVSSGIWWEFWWEFWGRFNEKTGVWWEMS